MKIHIHTGLAVLIVSMMACTKTAPENRNITIAIQPFRDFDIMLIGAVQSGIKGVYGNVNIVVLSAKDLPVNGVLRAKEQVSSRKTARVS
jgi:hypothetical protein